MNSYGKLIGRINSIDYYQCKVGILPKEFRVEHTANLPEYLLLVNNFNELPNYQQRNISNLIWFILYCKKYKLDSPQSYNIWKHYARLAEEIKFVSEDFE
ncbi:hypothetical protein H6G74_17055 [Nostoc spongiaeforme FACHB-130]|uniref:Uncharacterized protein n=2 Tax=Nostoc TaxID=1177 RepID=A0ABR8FZF3_9NOSO|nr:hypothetical protein [Nostoc spongiaeforme FACHB-130]